MVKRPAASRGKKKHLAIFEMGGLDYAWRAFFPSRQTSRWEK